MFFGIVLLLLALTLIGGAAHVGTVFLNAVLVAVVAVFLFDFLSGRQVGT